MLWLMKRNFQPVLSDSVYIDSTALSKKKTKYATCEWKVISKSNMEIHRLSIINMLSKENIKICFFFRF